MKTVTLHGGEAVPALGLGTWRMGERSDARSREVAAVRTAIDIGYRLIDTAEMYGEGGAEEVLGEALDGAMIAGAVTREDLFIVSKVYPHHAGRHGALTACERSLKRMKLDCIDLYLLHWRGQYPLAETIDAFETLKAQGKIRHWGVSNFDVDDLHEMHALSTPRHRTPPCATNQVYYSMSERGIEWSLLPLQRSLRMPLMAYSPIDQGALADHSMLALIAERNGLTAAQVALAWVMRHPDVIAIPKAVQASHLRDNWAAASVQLGSIDLTDIDKLYPPPGHKTPLGMI